MAVARSRLQTPEPEQSVNHNLNNWFTLGIAPKVTRRKIAHYIADELAFQMWERQEEIANAVETYPRTAVRSCHAAGKSTIAARVALAYLQTRQNSIVITTAPTDRQVENVLWRHINTAAISAPANLPGRALKKRYEIAPDWYALGFKGDSKNSDAFQGFHAEDILVIIDEAAGVPEPVMEAVEAILTGTGARLLLIGNPTSVSGTFRAAFHSLQSMYHTIRISAYDTPNFTHFGITRDDMASGAWEDKVGGRAMPFPALIDPGWVAFQIARHGGIDRPYLRSRVDADFPTGGANSLFDLADIEACENMGDELWELVDDETSHTVGVDVARYGDDETAISIRKGAVEVAMVGWRDESLTESSGRIAGILGDHGATTGLLNIDANGMGAGLAEMMKNAGYRVNEVNVGQASSNRAKWPNLRHELWWQLKERYRERLIAPAPFRVNPDGSVGTFDDVMKGQLSDVLYKSDPNYLMPLIERKEDAKKRGVSSPDRAEAQMMCYGKMPPPKRKRRVNLLDTLAVAETMDGWDRSPSTGPGKYRR